MYIYICIYICIYIYVHIYMYIYICTRNVCFYAITGMLYQIPIHRVACRHVEFGPGSQASQGKRLSAAALKEVPSRQVWEQASGPGSGSCEMGLSENRVYSQ